MSKDDRISVGEPAQISYAVHSGAELQFVHVLEGQVKILAAQLGLTLGQALAGLELVSRRYAQEIDRAMRMKETDARPPPGAPVLAIDTDVAAAKEVAAQQHAINQALKQPPAGPHIVR